MEDLISRQAVQDYIAKYLSQFLYDDVRQAIEVIDEYIGELPSVKPQVICPSYGIDCKDCPAYESKTDTWSIKDVANTFKKHGLIKELEPILEKIKTEIEQIEINGNLRDVECFSAGINASLNVINKYRAESEEVNDTDI